MGMVGIEITLLGSFEVKRDHQPLSGFESDKARALLAYLATETDRPHRREALAGLFWPDTPETTARTNLRSALANIRKVIGDHQADPPFLIITRQTIQFNRLSAAWVDVEIFSRAAADETPSNNIQRLHDAAALYKGHFLGDFFLAGAPSFEEWALD